MRPHALSRAICGKLGDHRLLVGDAGDTAALSRLLTAKAAMAFTDPPYNVAYGDHGGQQQGQRKRRIANDAMPCEQWEAFCRGWARSLLNNVDGAIYVCMSSWSDTIIWRKDRFTLGRADYQRQYEPIWFGWREGSKHQWHGGRDQGDVFEIDRPSESAAHPTMKPLALIEKAIENSSSRGDVVLDFFLGSGSTIIACERTGRVCFGTEIDPHYASLAIARWESFSGKEAQCLGSS